MCPWGVRIGKLSTANTVCIWSVILQREVNQAVKNHGLTGRPHSWKRQLWEERESQFLVLPSHASCIHPPTPPFRQWPSLATQPWSSARTDTDTRTHTQLLAAEIMPHKSHYISHRPCNFAIPGPNCINCRWHTTSIFFFSNYCHPGKNTWI